MCGVFGFSDVNKRNGPTAICEALSGVEYRGYDSAGYALLNGDTFLVRKAVGPLTNLQFFA